MKNILCALLVICSITGFSNSSLSPSSGNAGETLNVTITTPTAKFTQGSSSIRFEFGQGSSTANSPIILNDTVIVYNITIPPSTYSGNYYVSIYDYTSNTSDVEYFTVYGNPRPTIKSMSPNTASINETLQVSITGSNTHFSQGSSTSAYFNFNQGSSTGVNSLTVLNDSLISANVTIPANVTTGSYALYVNNSIDGSLTLSNAISITGLNPTIKSISPDSINAGETLNVTISGSQTSFGQGSSSSYVSFSFGQGSGTLNSFNVVNDSTIVANVTVASTTKTAAGTAYVSNSRDGSLNANFNIYEIPATAGGSSEPSFSGAGATTTVTLVVSSGSFNALSTCCVVFEGGIVTNSFTIVNDSTITVNITVPSSAADGDYDVYIYDEEGSNQYRLAQAFKIGSPNGTTQVINGTAALLYPNPSSDAVTVQAGTSNSTILFFDSKGVTKLKIEAASATNTINILLLPKGLYFVQVVDSENLSTTIKFIKN